MVKPSRLHLISSSFIRFYPLTYFFQFLSFTFSSALFLFLFILYFLSFFIFLFFSTYCLSNLIFFLYFNFLCFLPLPCSLFTSQGIIRGIAPCSADSRDELVVFCKVTVRMILAAHERTKWRCSFAETPLDFLWCRLHLLYWATNRTWDFIQFLKYLRVQEFGKLN